MGYTSHGRYTCRDVGTVVNYLACSFLSNEKIIVGTPEDCFTEETAGTAKELHHQERVSNFIEEEGLKGCYSTCFKDYVKVDESLLNENHCCSRKI